MKKTIITLFAIIALGLSSVTAEFDMGDWFCGLSTQGKLGFETENNMFGKKIGEKVAIGGIEATLPVCGGALYTGITGFFPTDPHIGPRSVLTGQFLNPQLNDAGNRLEVKAGYMMDLLCLPASDYLCVEDMTLSLDIGYTYYWWLQQGLANPWNQVNRSNEVYLGFITDGLLRPAAYVFYDFNLEQVRGELSIGHTIPLCFFGIDALALDANAYIGCLRARTYNGDQRGNVPNQRNSYTYGGASLDLVYALGEHADIRLGARWAANNDGKTKDSLSPNYLNQGGKQSRLWWGGSFNFAF